MARCPVCGALVNDGETVCRYCGAKVQEEIKAAQERKEKRQSFASIMHQMDDDTLLVSVKAKLYGLNGIEKNVDEALRLCEELANRGNTEGIYLLGVMKFDKGELETAYKLWKFAAKKGHEPSKLKLAVEFGRDSGRTTNQSYRDLDDEYEEEENLGDGNNVIDSVVMIATLKSCGSGFLTRDGYVITNAHVVDGYNSAQCFFRKELGNNGSPRKTHHIRVVKSSPEYDIAILEFADEDPMEFSDLGLEFQRDVRSEEKVKTIGYPLGLPFSVSKGIVSNPRQPFAASGKFQTKVEAFIQTDISVNGGNSGGPLINTAGEVVGVIASRPSEANGGIGFAIPIAYVERLLDHIR